ncbi:hypothetical protein AMEX_G25162, partial [Astyanax mexicanus]
SDAPTVTAPLHGSVVLSCSERCSGVVRWTVFSKRSDPLAECDQTSCRSVKEGYQMIYNQYLQGNLSLIITEADYSKRDWYTCECDGRDVCDVRLQIKPFPTVKVLYNGAAVLPCTYKCSGVISWSCNLSDPLAECDQTSCRSVKEGYQMIYNQYLKGNLSLIISKADFSKRGLYTADCDGRDLCEVELQIKALNSTVQIQSGESLLLKLKRSDQVEVVYNSTEAAGSSSVKICTVYGYKLKCKDNYTQRTSLLPDLKLRDMKKSDSGVYTIRDTRNNEEIQIYTVTVRGTCLVWE